ncbi:hypothetical protein Taro_054134 [Colocasia esculenta]|uniref:Uncharacterized protein n=1 Tax=Colocasia esculenta TaxID=4460 RepID=A0A843XPS8_COLES|nr:hypothetical protein [Colocasia esculenta]
MFHPQLRHMTGVLWLLLLLGSGVCACVVDCPPGSSRRCVVHALWQLGLSSYNLDVLLTCCGCPACSQFARSTNPSHCLSQRWFRSHVVVSGVGPQLDQAAVVRCGGSLASLFWGGCRQEPVAGEQRSGCISVYGSLTSWRVRGPECFCLWALGLVEIAEGCFRMVSDSTGSAGVVSGPTLVVGRGVTLFRCFVLFEFITYLTGLNSNPFGSLDLWVVARPLGSLAGVQEVGSLQFNPTRIKFLKYNHWVYCD